MARTSKALRAVDAHSAELLAQRVSDSGKSLRDLAADTGMSVNRIGIILRKQPPPATIGEIGVIAEAVGTTASAIVAAAETAVSGERDDHHDDYDLIAKKRGRDRGQGDYDGA